MKSSLTAICLTLVLSLGTISAAWSAEPVKSYCLAETKHSHFPLFGKCSNAYQSGDHATALREWAPLAEQGNAPAQFNLGQLYRRGQGFPRDYNTAVKWFTLAAE